MDREIEKGVLGVERRVYKRTSVSSTRLRQKMRMEVNMSDYSTEGVLLIEYKDRRWRLVVFLSKSLNETEKNYEIHDKKMLAVIKGLENWRHLLKGTKFKFKIWTDHKNLEYFMKV